MCPPPPAHGRDPGLQEESPGAARPGHHVHTCDRAGWASSLLPPCQLAPVPPSSRGPGTAWLASAECHCTAGLLLAHLRQGRLAFSSRSPPGPRVHQGRETPPRLGLSRAGPQGGGGCCFRVEPWGARSLQAWKGPGARVGGVRLLDASQPCGLGCSRPARVLGERADASLAETTEHSNEGGRRQVVVKGTVGPTIKLR